jgi:hypothetical protein
MKYEPAHRAYSFDQAMRQWLLPIAWMRNLFRELPARRYQLEAAR